MNGQSRCSTPAILRPVHGRIQVWTPYRPGNRGLLREHLPPGCQLAREGCVWTVARVHLRRMINACLDAWDAVRIVSDYRSVQKCDTRCVEALGTDCVCSCLGDNHGAGTAPGHVLVSETTLVGPSEVQRIERVYTRKEAS